jgi:type IV secretion system protein VirB1
MIAITPQPQTPVLSSSLDDLLIPGVMVEVDADVADEHGAFEEHALSEAEAWDANGDLSPEGASNE